MNNDPANFLSLGLGFAVETVSLIAAAALFCWGAARILIPLAIRIGWTDRPDARKRHDGEVPLVGGAAIMISLGLCMGLFWSWPPSAYGLAVGGVLMFIMGAFDDRYPVSARYRFLVQIAAAIAIIALGDTLIRELGECCFPGKLGLSILAVPFSIICIVGLVNAYNMSDGLDGLCGGYALSAVFWFTVAAFLSDSSVTEGLLAEILPVSLAVIGALVGFLALNARAPWRARARIFLGDGGSMVLGLVIAWLAIRLTQPYDGFKLSPSAAVWIVAVPVADMFASIIRRLLEGRTPMSPDRRHLHHWLMESGVAVGASAYRLNFIAFSLGGIGVLGWYVKVPEYLMLWLLVVAFAVVCRRSIKFWQAHDHREAKIAASSAGRAARPNPRTSVNRQSKPTPSAQS